MNVRLFNLSFSGCLRPVFAAAAMAMLASSANAGDPLLKIVPDTARRQVVTMPEEAKHTLRMEMLARMWAVQKVLQAVAEGKPQEAEKIAHEEIGTDVIDRHAMRSPEAVPANYLPPDMMLMAKKSHFLGDELALTLRGGNRQKIDAKLAELIGNCVACHKRYTLK